MKVSEQFNPRWTHMLKLDGACIEI